MHPSLLMRPVLQYFHRTWTVYGSLVCILGVCETRFLTLTQRKLIELSQEPPLAPAATCLSHEPARE